MKYLTVMLLISLSLILAACQDPGRAGAPSQPRLE